MEKRELSLLKTLWKKGEYISGETLCDELGISPRTLRDDIRSLSDTLEETQCAVIKQKRNLGYYLEILDQNRFRVYMKQQLEMEEISSYSRPSTQDERVMYYMRRLLEHRGFVNINDMLDEIYVSKSTFQSDNRKLKEVLDVYHLKLERRLGSEIRIIGNEVDIRKSIRFALPAAGKQDYETTIRRILLSVFEKEQFRMTDYGFENLVTHLTIAIMRIQIGSTVQNTEMDHSVKQMMEFHIAQTIAHRLCESFQIILPENEIYYIAIHLLNGNSGSGQVLKQEVIDLVLDVMDMLEAHYAIHFHRDGEVFRSMVLHVQIMLDRIRYGSAIENPMAEEIKRENPLAYDMAMAAGQYLSEWLQTPVVESEFSYLALYFQLALDDSRTVEKKRILVVCAGGEGSSRVLKRKIEKQYGEYLEHIETASCYTVPMKIRNQYDCIITTVPLKVQTEIPVIQVQCFLNQEDMGMIRRMLTNNKSDYEYAMDSFRQSFVFTDIRSMPRDALIHEMIQKVREQVPVPDLFEKLVLEREELSPTEFGNGVAMPHPKYVCMDRSFVAIGILKTAVAWNKEKVRYIVMPFIEKGAGPEIEFFNDILAELILDQKALTRLEKAPDKETLLREVEEICSLAVNNSNEDFFR